MPHPKRHPSHRHSPHSHAAWRRLQRLLQGRSRSARPVQRHGIDRFPLLVDEKNGPAGNAKEAEEETRHDIAGDTGAADARQGGSEGPRRGCFRTARSTPKQQPRRRRFIGSEPPRPTTSQAMLIPPHTTIPARAQPCPTDTQHRTSVISTRCCREGVSLKASDFACPDHMELIPRRV